MKFVIASILTCSAVGFAVVNNGVFGPGALFLQESAQEPMPVQETTPSQWERMNVLRAEARQHGEQFEFDQVIEKCTEILNQGRSNGFSKRDFNSANAEVLLLRGRAFLGKGFPLIALDDFNDAVDFADNETKPAALVERARVASQIKRYSQAISDCSLAIRLQPDFGQAYLVRGQALSAAGKLDLAQRSLAEAERLGIRTTFKVPVEISAVDQARDLLDQGSAGLAREVLSQALLEGKNNWQINGLLALAQYQLNEYYRAISASNRALNMNPEFADGYRIRGLSHFQRRNYDAAVIDFKSAIELEPEFVQALAPFLAEARELGGVDPAIRVKVLGEIKEALVQTNEALPNANGNERWLLELNSMPSSADQVRHFQDLLKDNKDSSVESLNWLADFLLLDRRVPSMKNLRNYLQRPLQTDEQLSELEQGLRETISSRTAASAKGVNLFPDAVSYAVFYDFHHLLKSFVDAGVCHLKLQHVAQSLTRDDSQSLRILIPNASLLNRDVKGLLVQAMEMQKVEAAQNIIDRYNDQLNAQIIEFLGVGE